MISEEGVVTATDFTGNYTEVSKTIILTRVRVTSLELERLSVQSKTQQASLRCKWYNA
ncbi:MAG: hypothetical protein Ct9H90mP16_03500 [Candidatus Poseidoniales archaeon]|nr:MAG: hypothetical protein Ct9H90mP16_03500 [Candidatus Poseidoniales archaeon]